MKKLFFPFLLLIAVNSFAQTPTPGPGMSGNIKGMMEKMKVGHLYGKIVDSTSGKAIEFCSVQLIGNMFDTLTKAVKKDVIIDGQLTKENGDFSLEKVNVTGRYTLKIASMGYKTREFHISFSVDP